MKRKSLIFPFSLCLFIVTAGTGYASGTDNWIAETGKVQSNYSAMQKSKNGTEEVEVTPTYVTALSTFINLSILNGRATATVQINAKSADALTKAKASIQFIRSGSGNIKTYSGTMSKAGRKYTFKKTYQLPKRGNYYIKATIKCYKNGKRIETIKKTSKVVAY